MKSVYSLYSIYTRYLILNLSPISIVCVYCTCVSLYYSCYIFILCGSSFVAEAIYLYSIVAHTMYKVRIHKIYAMARAMDTINIGSIHKYKYLLYLIRVCLYVRCIHTDINPQTDSFLLINQVLITFYVLMIHRYEFLYVHTVGFNLCNTFSSISI